MDDAELDELMDDIVEVIELHDQLHPSEPDDKESCWWMRMTVA